jgi:hypothetical protein
MAQIPIALGRVFWGGQCMMRMHRDVQFSGSALREGQRYRIFSAVSQRARWGSKHPTLIIPGDAAVPSRILYPDDLFEQQIDSQLAHRVRRGATAADPLPPRTSRPCFRSNFLVDKTLK